MNALERHVIEEQGKQDLIRRNERQALMAAFEEKLAKSFTQEQLAMLAGVYRYRHTRMPFLAFTFFGREVYLSLEDGSLMVEVEGYKGVKKLYPERDTWAGLISHLRDFVPQGG